MIEAILASVVAVILVVAVIVAGFIIYGRVKSRAGVSQKTSVTHIETVREDAPIARGAENPRVQSEKAPNANPGDSLKARFLAMGVLGVGIFGSLTAKLFSMQVVNSSVFATEADENAFSTVSTPAPRGYICDATGVPIVKNRPCLTVLADSDVADNRNTVARLSAVLGIPRNVVRQRIQDSSSGAQSQRIVASDVRMRDVAFISEHSDAFPGVTVETRTVRSYPYEALAAHVVGYTGTVAKEDLEVVQMGRSLEMGDDVGKSGIEAAYDSLLSGDHGERVVIADADGNVHEVVSETQPKKGSDVYLTIDAEVQYVADQALANLIAPKNGTIGTGTGVGGAVVAMDVTDGSILALSNYPTYSPETFIGGISQDDWDVYNTEESHTPLLNRAIAGRYPAASTYKAFTSLVGLELGLAGAADHWKCTGKWDGFHSGDIQMCWDHTGHGKLDLHGGIVHSCDVVFYEIAKDFFNGVYNDKKFEPEQLRGILKRWRLDEPTGIDISGESSGVIPSPEWKQTAFADQPEEAVWRGGDQTNMMIGQGYVLVTPIEIAVAYGGIATGKIVKPHLLKEVRNAQGDVVLSYTPEVVAEPEVNPEHLKYVRAGLRGVVTDNEDTAKLFPKSVKAAGKTGTAEVAGKEDSAWFVCYAPYDDPKYVVATFIDEGGGGSATAAPIGAEVMNAIFSTRDKSGDLKVGKVAASSGKSIKRGGSSGQRTD